MKTKILVVDNEQDVAKALKVRLKTSGYEVVLAFDSVHAYTLAQEERPDLIILETFIPGGGGLLVAERLKESASTRHIPIIFLTEISGCEKRAYRAGARSYLMKPYNPHVLLGEIKKALEADDNQNLGITPLPA
jgi:DNA-binding response OmpR family regulator